jgi:hypothetical protein
MGGIISNVSRDDSNSTTRRGNGPESVNIKLSCTDFGTFNGRSDHWISFKENILSKAGVGGYAQYFQQDFCLTEQNKEGNNRIFYLLQMPPMVEAHHMLSESILSMQMEMEHGKVYSPGMKVLLCMEKLPKRYVQNYGDYA